MTMYKRSPSTINNYSANLCDLPEDVLIMIFEYCDIKTICRLSETCKKFLQIIRSEDIVWRSSSMNVIGSNMSAPAMQARCKPTLSYLQRCKFSKKWLRTYGYMNVVSHYPKCMPWCNLQREYFYCSMGRVLRQYKRKDNGDVALYPNREVYPFNDDVSKFSVTGKEVVCAGRDGKVARFDKHDLHMIDSFTAHQIDILAIDSSKDITITGGKDAIVKIWKAHSSKTECKKEIIFENRVLSAAIMPSNTSFVVGSPGTKSMHPLKFFDLERAKHLFNFCDYYTYGAGILDIFPETNNTLFACGYDANLQLWDVRTPERSVASWLESNLSDFHCVQTDYNVTMMTGSAAPDGSSRMWDKRVPDIPVKTFYMPDNRSRIHKRCTNWQKGPTYSVAFDASHKYFAFEKTLFEFTIR